MAEFDGPELQSRINIFGGIVIRVSVLLMIMNVLISAGLELLVE